MPRNLTAVVFGQVGHVLVQQEVIGRPIAQPAAVGRHHFAGKAVPRFVVGHALPHPLVERPHRRLWQPTGGDEQQVGPLVRPVIDVFRPLQQSIDQPVAAVGRFIGQELAHLFRSGQRPGAVEEGAADELAVAAQRRRRQVQTLQLLQDQGVDEVVPGGSSEHLQVHRLRQWRQDAPGGDLVGEPDGDGRLAVAGHGRLALGIDGGHQVVAAVVLGPAGHVLHAAIGVPGPHGQLQCVLRLERGLRRLDLQPHNAGVVLAWPHGLAANPVREDTVFWRADVEFLAALVGEGQGRLEQEEAASGCCKLSRRPRA